MASESDDSAAKNPHVANAHSCSREEKHPDANIRMVVLFVLTLHACLLAWGAYRHSPTVDETRWLPAGLVNWQQGHFRVARVNPPLVRMVAAVPVMAALSSTQHADSKGASAYRGLNELDGATFVWLFTLGRWACIPFSLVGGYICFRWARELYGTAAGLVSLTLWCFSPNILAHGQIVAYDAPAAALAIAAAFAFWTWLRQPTWDRVFVAGAVLGVAELTKFTLILFFGLWPIVWLAWYFSRPVAHAAPRFGMQLAQLLLLLSVALNILNFGYWFSGSFRQLKDYSFVSRTLSGVELGNGNRFSGTWLGELPVPLPRDYVLGVDQQKGDFEGKNLYAQTYLRGQWRDSGLWYYYLYALAIKVPLGTWSLLLLSIGLRAFGLDGLKLRRDEILLVLPALTFLCLASSQTGFTDHLRYVLPMFPFVFVWASRAAWVLMRLPRTLFFIAATSLTWTIGSSLWIYPHSLSYFNEVVGGPRNGHYHLVSSNIDYGQDLLYLKEWLDQHRGARPFHLAYWNPDTIDPGMLGIDYSVSPSGPSPSSRPPDAQLEKLGPQPGWHAANANALRGDGWPGRSQLPELGYYGFLLSFEPVAMAGYSIYIYEISLEDAARVRTEMDLPPLVNHGVP